MNDKNANVTVTASVPNRKTLCCVIGEIDFIEVQDSSAKSNFQWQVMKCRLIILTIPEVIASPIFGSNGSMYIITSTTFFETGKLQRALMNLNILFGNSCPVSFSAYKACLSYTIQCKLAPHWNKVGEYLIHGKNFLNSAENLDAIKLDIIMSDETTQFQLQAKVLKVPFIKLENLYFFYSSMGEFLADPNGYIDVTQYGSHWVYVLPSMKRGRLISISKEIPSKCPFKDYEQLRRHWKNMYGYIFPNNNEILYYQVKFPVPGSNCMTYPNFCLATTSIETNTCCNIELLTNQFLSDIIRALPTICNEKLDIQKYVPQQNQAPAILMRTPENNFHTDARLSLPRHQLFTTDPEFAAPCSIELEFSGNYIDRQKDQRKKQRQSPLTSTKYLSKIHEIHCPSTTTNGYKKFVNCANSSANEINNAGNLSRNKLTLPSSSSEYNKNADIMNVNVEEREETTSEYFNWEEVSPPQNDKKSHMSLKQKLQSTKNKRNSNTSMSDVEKMAKNHTLGLLTCEVLRDWLTFHSITFLKRSTKPELICKVMTHIKDSKKRKST